MSAPWIEAARGARRALPSIRASKAGTRTKTILAMARELRASEPAILQANTADVQDATARRIGAAKLDRLRLDARRIEEMAAGLDTVASLPDPLGRVVDERRGPTGIRVRRVRVPIGVILMIFEARPNVTAEAAALCLRSGNAVLLRGGSESARSNRAIGASLRAALAATGLPAESVTIVEGGHEAVDALLALDDVIDLVIPRGGPGLIRTVAERSRIPVIKHYLGNCHVYVDAAADPAMAEQIVFNAKVERPATCNAAEKLLIHRAVAPSLLPRIGARLQGAGVELRGDAEAAALVPGTKPAAESDWAEEYLDLVMAVKVVAGIDEAIAHVNAHGSGHTDAIVTADAATARRFLDEVDSSSVMWNCSTRLADGGQYGLGAEIGISTGRLHARGPMGAEELTCLKWVVEGEGQLRS